MYFIIVEYSERVLVINFFYNGFWSLLKDVLNTIILSQGSIEEKYLGLIILTTCINFPIVDLKKVLVTITFSIEYFSLTYNYTI